MINNNETQSSKVTYKQATITICACLVLVLICCTASATTYTVCASGCDYTTIQAAENAASGGDTVYVYNGTYAENIVVDTGFLTIQGEGMDVVNVTASVHVFDVDAGYVNITGMNITGAGSTYANIHLDGNYDYCNFSYNRIADCYDGIVVRGAGNDHNLVLNNTITQYTDVGVMGRDSSYLNVTKNYLHHGAFATLIRDTGAECFVVGNWIKHNTARGLYQYGTATDLTHYDNWVENCTPLAYGGTAGTSWNISKRSGTNIFGGSYIGGNYWDDYSGVDNDGDGLGNTATPYTCGGNITSGGDYLPLCTASSTTPVPTNLQKTTGEWWVNHTWDAGSGYETDSYNFSINTTWHNGTTNTSHNNSGLAVYSWSNITVYAWNNTYGISLSSVDEDVQLTPAPTTRNCAHGDICVNTTHWWRDDAEVNSSSDPIAAGIGAATSYQTVYIFNGSYTENVAESDTSHLTVNGEGRDVVHITPATTTMHIFNISGSADYFNLSGVHVSGGSADIFGIYFLSMSHGNVTNCNASDVWGCGIVGQYCDYINVVGNIACNNSIRGITFPYYSNNSYFADNIIMDNPGRGLDICTHGDNSTFKNNTVLRNGLTMVATHYSGINCHWSDNILYDECRSYGNYGYRDHLIRNDANNITIRNPANPVGESFDFDIEDNDCEWKITNTDGQIFTEDSGATAYAYPSNFSMHRENAIETFTVTLIPMTLLSGDGQVTATSISYNNAAGSEKYNVTADSTNTSEVVNYTASVANATHYYKCYLDGSLDHTTQAVAGVVTWNYESGFSTSHELSIMWNSVLAPISTYIPPTPTTLANTTGNFWVNHTWSAGSGNVTNSYNVSQNSTWHNTTTTPHFNATSVGAHGHSDITVYAFNSSSTGTLSAGNITQNTTVPNNAITITNTSDWSGSPGSNVYVDYDATDADSDTPTFYCNRTDLFADFSTSTGKGNWTATAGTYYVDFGVSDGYGSTSNYTMTITGGAVAPIITLIAQTPSTIFQNTTGYLNISYGISHDSSGLNNTSVSFIFRNYDHTSNDANHSIRPPANDKCEMWNFDGQIIRGANRNETLNFENNDTITGGDIFTWSGMDENNTRLTIVPVNSTYTIVHINGTIHDLAMEQMWYLDRTDMVEAPKTQLAIHKTQDVVIKFWNAEIFKGNYDFIGMGYTDTSLESAPAAHPSDANPVSFYYLNSSYDPLGGVDPLGGAVFMGSLNATQWVDHVYSPDQNASYVRGAINNTLLNSVINTTEISYLYFRSNTPSSKPFYINITDSSTNTNRTFGQNNVLWIGDTAPYTAHPYTPNVWFAFVYDNTTFDHKLYVADNNDKWGNSTLQTTNVGAGLFSPTKPSINHFHFNGSDDYNINKTYSGTIEVYIGVGTDPDGGTVTHNLTLHYKNQTLVAIINNTFTDTDILGNGVYAEIPFNTTPYYSETEEYTLRVIATDDEGETSESWSCCNFTLGTHQISNLHTTTLVYNRIVWEWVNPDYYDTIMVYLDNVWKQNTTGTYYSASSLSQQTAYTIKLITVYAGVESDPATDTRVTPAKSSGGGGGGTYPTPTPTATPTITPLLDENVTENVSITIETIPDITKDTIINETVHTTVWHLSFEKHGVYIPYHANIVSCTAIPPYACRYYGDQKKFEIVIDGESPNPVFVADQWVTFITRDGERISQRIQTKVYNPLFYFTFTPISASVTGVMRYFVHGDENMMDGVRVWWLGLLGMGLIAWVWRRKK